jgi:hypothetical protein
VFGITPEVGINNFCSLFSLKIGTSNEISDFEIVVRHSFPDSKCFQNSSGDSHPEKAPKRSFDVSKLFNVFGDSPEIQSQS